MSKIRSVKVELIFGGQNISPALAANQDGGCYYLRVLTMPIGTVKWFNVKKRYGFIQPEDGSKDVFVHATAVEAAGLDTLQEGQKVRFELSPDPQGRTMATEISVSY